MLSRTIMTIAALALVGACASGPNYPQDTAQVPTRKPGETPPGGFPEDQQTPGATNPQSQGGNQGRPQQGGGQQGQQQGQNEGQRLSNNGLTKEFSNKSYYGCLNNAENTSFAERTDSDGTLRDLDQDGVVTGKWEVRSDRICYLYPNQDANANCFVVTKVGRGLNFYNGDPGQLVASTNCPIKR